MIVLSAALLEKHTKCFRGLHWDGIHFNWGLNNLKYCKDGKQDLTGVQLMSPEDYERNLHVLVKRLKSTKAKLIWVSTTPVPKGSNARVAGGAKKSNQVAKRVMQRNGIHINYLFNQVQPNLEKYQKPQNVHFVPESSKFLGEKVENEILEQLKIM